MKRCDSKAKRKCVVLIDQEDVCTIKYKGIAAPILENDCIIDKNINVLIREIDAKHCEEMAAKERVKEGWEWVDQDARNCFHGGVGARTLKCVYGFNHHGKRNTLINKGMVDSKCPRCGEDEDWEHVITCPSIQNIKEQYIDKLKEKLQKIARNEHDKEEVELIIDDIETYVMQRQKEYVTTQQVIGMDKIFKGWVVKNWIDVHQPQ